MSSVPRPHDLLWLRDGNALAAISESWVSQFWHPGLPVVVRRDRSETGLIPVGVRGEPANSAPPDGSMQRISFALSRRRC